MGKTTNNVAEYTALIRALGAMPEGKGVARLRDDIAAYLRARTQQTFGPEQGPWLKWLATANLDDHLDEAL